jgi:DNA-binding IclR family transcriptional regulator
MTTSSVIDRLLDILLLFGEGQETWSIDEIATMLALPKSTSYRLVRTLQDRGFLERASNGQFRLGVVLVRLGRLAISSNRDIRLMALPSMRRIADAVHESVSLMRLMNRRIVCIESIEGRYALRVSIQPGRTQPLHAGASSRVLLAALPEDAWEGLLEFPLDRFTETTIHDIEALRENLRRVRSNGYAVSDGEIDVGARAVAVPLRNGRDDVVAALSIEAPATRMTEALTARAIELLQTEAEAIRQEQR